MREHVCISKLCSTLRPAPLTSCFTALPLPPGFTGLVEHGAKSDRKPLAVATLINFPRIFPTLRVKSRFKGFTPWAPDSKSFTYVSAEAAFVQEVRART